MPATRSQGRSDADGAKRSAAPGKARPAKKAKKEKDGKLAVGETGEVELKKEEEKEDGDEHKKEDVEQNGGLTEDPAAKGNAAKGERGSASQGKEEQNESIDRSGLGETKQEGDEVDQQRQATSGAELDEPKHGTLESGHIFFLYRPKIDAHEVDSVDDISKFHILLIPTSAPHDKGHYHRIIEVGKKKLPDPGAKRQIIWGLVHGVGTDKADLKTAFGAYEYETKTKGTRHQQAARPAARGHYILHSPRDELADDPDHNRQRDYKMQLVYEITMPASEDFGNVQSELGIEPKGVVGLSVKEPNAKSNNNPRAASIPREKRASYPQQLMDLFHGRRWIPANPPSFLSYPGGELLILSTEHRLSDALGEDGEHIIEDLDKDAEKEQVGIDAAMKELGMSKGDTEIEALEGEWA